MTGSNGFMSGPKIDVNYGFVNLDDLMCSHGNDISSVTMISFKLMVPPTTKDGLLLL